VRRAVVKSDDREALDLLAAFVAGFRPSAEAIAWADAAGRRASDRAARPLFEAGRSPRRKRQAA
jgi:hypothetical protein